MLRGSGWIVAAAAAVAAAGGGSSGVVGKCMHKRHITYTHTQRAHTYTSCMRTGEDRGGLGW